MSNNKQKLSCRHCGSFFYNGYWTHIRAQQKQNFSLDLARIRADRYHIQKSFNEYIEILEK